MAGPSTIEWTEKTWNPSRGCSRISPGCQNCYAERQAARFCAKGQPFAGYAKMTKAGPKWTRKVSLVPNAITAPVKWNKPSFIFVNSMSDLFHEELSLEDIQKVFEVMEQCPQHTFQILTKRAERLAELAPSLTWPKNVWIGVSVENQEYVSRVDYLRRVTAQVRFLSVEPLLGPVHLDLTGIHWVIVGGESGPGARPMDLDWARQVRDQCTNARVPFFLKQLGGKSGKRSGPEAVLDGRTWAEMPRQ